MRLANPYSISLTNPMTLLSASCYVVFFLFCGLCVAPIANSVSIWEGALIWGPVFLIGAALGHLCRHGCHQVGRLMADRSVRRLVATLRSSTKNTPSFILYLRPHWLDGYTKLLNPYYSENRFLPGYWLHVSPISFDHLLSLELDLTVVALGTREMRISTGAIQVPDADWKELAATLIKKARTIVMVPAASQGLLWEIGEIERQERASSVVLMQPPELITGKSSSLDSKNNSNNSVVSVRDFWNTLNTSLYPSHGIQLTPYQEYGSVASLGQKPDKDVQRCLSRLKSAFDKYRRGTGLRSWIS